MYTYIVNNSCELQYTVPSFNSFYTYSWLTNYKQYLPAGDLLHLAHVPVDVAVGAADLDVILVLAAVQRAVGAVQLVQAVRNGDFEDVLAEGVKKRYVSYVPVRSEVSGP